MFNFNRWYGENPKTAVTLANVAIGVGIAVLAVGITLAVIGTGGGLIAGFILGGLLAALVANVVRKAMVLDQAETAERKASEPKAQSQKAKIETCPAKKSESKFTLFKNFLRVRTKRDFPAAVLTHLGRATSTSSAISQTGSPAPAASCRPN